MKHWLILLTVFLVACSTTGIKGPSDLSSIRRVERNKIYQGDVLYAELVFIGKHEYFEGRYRGIAIHYLEKDKYEWISPKKGWSLLHKENSKVIDNIMELSRIWVVEPWYEYFVLCGNKPAGSDSYFKIEWRDHVVISGDGVYVYYRDSSRLFSSQDRKYRVK